MCNNGVCDFEQVDTEVMLKCKKSLKVKGSISVVTLKVVFREIKLFNLIFYAL